MINQPFIDCPKRTQISDKYYGAFGRALYVAQQFEANCRSLTALFDVKNSLTESEVDPLDDHSFQNIVNKYWRTPLLQNLNKLKNYGLPEEVDQILYKARQARNCIAHEITIGTEYMIENDSGRSEIIKELEKRVREIAEGDKVIGLLIQAFTREPIPMPSYFETYQEEVARWICQTFDEI